ncbi:MAG: DivIVA domain-containing protein [Gaiellales bacterium]
MTIDAWAIRSASFGLAARGYNPTQVDALLERVASAVVAGRAVDPAELTDSFEDVASGYAADEVDRFLAALHPGFRSRAMQRPQMYSDVSEPPPAQAGPEVPPPPEIVSAIGGEPPVDDPSGIGTSLDEAAALLVAASVIEVETDRDTVLEIWTISHDGAVVSGSAPRLAVAPGMRVRHQVHIGPAIVIVEGVVESAEYRSEARAAITIRVTDAARVTGYERRGERFKLGLPATLRATICGRIVPGVVVPITLVDLSESGCAATSSDRRLRATDRLWLSARLLEGELGTEIRITRSTPPRDGTVTIGCVFVEPGPDSATLQRVLTRLDRQTD